MAYTPFQDGTQVFGIPDSPLSINSVTFIAEDIQLQMGQQVAEIKDPNGVPTGQVLIPQTITGSAKLQLSSSSIAPPARNQTFELQGMDFVLENVGTAYTQGAYAYVNVTFRQVLNPS